MGQALKLLLSEVSGTRKVCIRDAEAGCSANGGSEL